MNDEKLSNAPVYYALTQARFNPVLKMERYVDDIQDRLRKQGYPTYKKLVQKRIKVTSHDDGQATTDVVELPTWIMTNEERTAGFILTTEWLVYHTTHYETHSQFIPEFIKGIEAIYKDAEVDSLYRLGLRYLDAIVPKEGESDELYLVESLIGASYKGRRVRNINESVVITEETSESTSSLVAKVYRLSNSKLTFPPDLAPQGLKLNDRFDYKTIHPHAIVDTDHYMEAVIPLKTNTDYKENLQTYLKKLHGGVKMAFNASVSEHALNTWK